jgi:tRNA pseudouridine13 synthase
LKSLVWNHLATERVERYGLEVMEGDLVVLAEGFDRPMEAGGSGSGERPAKAARVEAAAGAGAAAAEASEGQPSASATGGGGGGGGGTELSWADDPAVSTGGKYTIRTLTAEDAASGRYSMSDLVLPLPGWDVIYPGNDLGPKYGPACSALPDSDCIRPSIHVCASLDFLVAVVYLRLPALCA